MLKTQVAGLICRVSVSGVRWDVRIGTCNRFPSDAAGLGTRLLALEMTAPQGEAGERGCAAHLCHASLPLSEDGGPLKTKDSPCHPTPPSLTRCLEAALRDGFLRLRPGLQPPLEREELETVLRNRAGVGERGLTLRTQGLEHSGFHGRES